MGDLKGAVGRHPTSRLGDSTGSPVVEHSHFSTFSFFAIRHPLSYCFKLGTCTVKYVCTALEAKITESRLPRFVFVLRIRRFVRFVVFLSI